MTEMERLCLRFSKGLNIADCFPYATAKDQRIPIFTLDEGFRAADLEVIGAG